MTYVAETPTFPTFVSTARFVLKTENNHGILKTELCELEEMGARPWVRSRVWQVICHVSGTAGSLRLPPFLWVLTVLR